MVHARPEHAACVWWGGSAAAGVGVCAALRRDAPVLCEHERPSPRRRYSSALVCMSALFEC